MSTIIPNFVLKQPNGPVTDLQFCTCMGSSMLIASYSGNAGIDIWDLQTRRSFKNIPSTKPILSVYCFRTGEILILNKEGSLKLVDTSSGNIAVVFQLDIPNVGFCKISVLSDCEEKILALPGEPTSSINVWNLSTKTIFRQLIPKFQLGMPWCIKLCKKPKMIAVVGYEDGSLLCWDVTKQEILSSAFHLYSDPVMCIDICPDETNCSITGIAASVTNCIFKWKAVLEENSAGMFPKINQTNRPIEKSSFTNFSVLKQHNLINDGVSCVKIQKDKKIIALGSWDHKVRILSWKTLKPLAVLNFHSENVQAIDFSDDNLLACGSNDNKISIWKIYL